MPTPNGYSIATSVKTFRWKSGSHSKLGAGENDKKIFDDTMFTLNYIISTAAMDHKHGCSTLTNFMDSTLMRMRITNEKWRQKKEQEKWKNGTA